ncbi:MFS transporter [Sphingomonas sp. LHG3406-1]|uniref:MFS transporter n=1 Tax=Sphingomonas sp. LHG3406-1 TaxID=2804617 RepID=UPI00263A07A1|nr:MFS transporter [Sphingomonas sp. LHG3406-1]
MAAGTLTVDRGWPALSEHRRLRFLTIFLLYVAQGLPIGFFHFAVPAWMAANGASAAAIGTVASAATLPWSLKLINGFLMDRWAFLAMGRRRSWLIGAQSLIVVSMLVMAIVGPGPQAITLLAAFGFVANLFTTIQDVAIDGMAIDLIPEEERGRANGFMFGGQALGMAIGTSLTGYLLYLSGMDLAAAATALIVAAPLSLIILLRERPGERLMPWTPGQPSDHALALHAGAWKPILVGVFRASARLHTLLFLAGMMLANVVYGLFIGFTPLLGTSEVGWNDAQISALTGTANLVGAVAAIFFVGWIVDRAGARAVSTFVALSGVTLVVAMFSLRTAWEQPSLFAIFVIGVLVIDTAIRTSSCAVAMRLCDPKVGATQFGLFMAAGNFGITIGASLLGTLDRWAGTPGIVFGMIAAYAAATLCFFLARVGR